MQTLNTSFMEFLASLIVISLLASLPTAAFAQRDEIENETPLLAEPLNKNVFALPAPVTDLVVGGGGRFIICKLSEKRQFSVFDVAEQKLVFTIPMLVETAQFAAGQTRLLVIAQPAELIQEWNLDTGKLTRETSFPIDGIVKQVAMGAASEGPMLITWADGLSKLSYAHWGMLDIDTLAISRLPENTTHNRRYRDLVHIRASGNGRVFGIWCTSHTPSGLETLVFDEDGKMVTARKHDSAHHLVPNHKGDVIYTGAGSFDQQLEFEPQAGVDRHSWCVPAVSGSFFLSGQITHTQLAFTKPHSKMFKMVSLRASGIDDAIITLPPEILYYPDRRSQWWQHDFSHDKRTVFVPQLKRIVVVPEEPGNELHIYDFDPYAAMKESGQSLLRITSVPPVSTQKGKQFSYQVVTETLDKPVTFRLDDGPDGMACSKDGLITWDVPAEDSQLFTRVTATVRNSSGAEEQQGFVLVLADEITP